MSEKTTDQVGELYIAQREINLETEAPYLEWVKPLEEKGYVDSVTLRQAFNAGYWQGKIKVLRERAAELQASAPIVDEEGNVITECYCDPCGDENCDCRGKRCNYCLENQQ
jgi:hypothetical protein